MIAVLGIGLAAFVVDWLTKCWVKSALIPNQSLPVLDGFFHLTYVQNPGAAFGILAERTTFFVMVTAAVVVLILFFAARQRGAGWTLRLALGMMLGGAMGNLLDRLRFGHVVDFLDFRIWPVFNMADTFIVLGVGLFLISMWRYSTDAAGR
ncbi:MAG TPA: signal peptidase II [Firmicutes bacterium]|jgi:signal peptidase II|nr:signal peptidase II [Bacillota bacterium]